MSEENITALNNWVKSLPILARVEVRFDDDDARRWFVRVCAASQGPARPIRTHSGPILDVVCAELLPLAKKQWENMGAHLIKLDKEYRKKSDRNMRRDMREVIAMHGSAADF